MQKIAFFPGTFDPFTNGHLEIIKNAVDQKYEVVIGIGTNSSKTPWFSEIERKSMIDKVMYDNGLHHYTKTVIYTGLTIEAAKANYAGCIIRGVRNVIDREYENQILEINLHLSEIPTIIVDIGEGKSIIKYISSSIVRELVKNSKKWPEYIKDMVPDAVMDALKIRAVIPILKERFIKLFERNGGYRRDAEYCFDIILQKYSDPKRYYHGILHIADLLNKFDNMIWDNQSLFTDPDLVELAIFLHDIEMDFMVSGGLNEINSAKFAQYVVAKYLNKDHWYNQIYNLIMVTRYPSSNPITNDEKLFIALDLSIFGIVQPYKYEKYLKGIRYEYKFANDEQWKIGRIQFLKSLMESNCLKNNVTLDIYKNRFKRNIEIELENLQA